MNCDAKVGRQCPWRCRPNQDEHFSPFEGRINFCRVGCQRKLHINRWTAVLSVFHLRFSERRLIVDAPIDGPRAFVNEAALDEASKQTRRFGLVMIRHRDVGIVPFAQDAQSLKIPRLSLQRIRSELAARPPNAERWHVGLFLAQLPFHV